MWKHAHLLSHLLLALPGLWPGSAHEVAAGLVLSCILPPVLLAGRHQGGSGGSKLRSTFS